MISAEHVLLFQSHAGSIEAIVATLGGALDQTFQSHAGSIEARGDRSRSAWPIWVSIPRWFD